MNGSEETPNDIPIAANSPQGMGALFRGESSIFINLLVIDVQTPSHLSGTLTLTNVRIFWECRSNKEINVTIPLRVITKVDQVSNQSVNKKTRSCVEIKATSHCRKYKFLFSFRRPLTKALTLIKTAISNYRDSYLLRELSLRSAIVDNSRLILLRGEYVVMHLDGLVNILGRSGKIGAGILTNFRFVWYSTIVENFNLSVPLMMVPPLELINHSRFSHCFYISLLHSTKPIVFGFTFGSKETLLNFINTVNKTRETTLLYPMLTYPTYDIQVSRAETLATDERKNEEDFSIIDADPIMKYFDAVIDEDSVLPIVYDNSIGLSIEQSAFQCVVSDLWNSASHSRFKTLAEAENL